MYSKGDIDYDNYEDLDKYHLDPGKQFNIMIYQWNQIILAIYDCEMPWKKDIERNTKARQDC